MSEQEKDVSRKKKSKVILFVVPLICIVIAAVVVVITANSPARRFRKQLDLGQKYLEDMEYEKAIAAFEAAIEIDPNSADAYVGLAKAYLGLGDLEKARKAFKKAIKLNPDYEEEYAELAKALLDHQEAKKDKETDPAESSLSSEDEGGSETESQEPEESKEPEETKEPEESDEIKALDEDTVKMYVPQYANGGVLIVTQDGKYGAMDYAGNLIVPCEYTSYANPSDTGYFALLNGIEKKVFSRDGRLIDTIDCSGSIYTSNEAYTFDDWNASEVTYKKYDGTVLYHGEHNYYEFTPFCEGKALVSNYTEGNVCVTLEGTSLINDPIYLDSYDSVFSQGMFMTSSANVEYQRVMLCTWDGKPVGRIDLTSALIDENGKLQAGVLMGGEDGTEPMLFGKVDPHGVDGQEISGITYRWYAKEGGAAYNYGSKIVLANNKKEILVDFAKLTKEGDCDLPVYDYIGICDEKYWLISTDGKWGYCDHDGNVIKLYEDAAKFQHGLAFIVDGGMVYEIDESLNVVRKVCEGVGVYASGDLFCVIDAANGTHYYVCGKEQ